MSDRTLSGGDACRDDARRDWDEDLSALIDGELDPGRRDAVESHLATCTRCSGRLEALRAVDARLAEVPLPEIGDRLTPPRIVVESSAPEVAASRPRPRTAPPPREPTRAAWKTSFVARVATAAGIVLGLLWLLEQGRESMPLPSPGTEAPAIAHAPDPAGASRATPEAVAPPQPTDAPAPETLAASEAVASPDTSGAAAPLESASEEELALALDLETVEDFEVIANLELLEWLAALDEGRG